MIPTKTPNPYRRDMPPGAVKLTPLEMNGIKISEKRTRFRNNNAN